MAHTGHLRAFRYTEQYLLSMEDTLRAIIGMAVERKSGANNASVATKYPI